MSLADWVGAKVDEEIDMNKLQMSIVIDENGDYYAEFWENHTGKSVAIAGEEYTNSFSQRDEAARAAHQMLRSVLDGKVLYELI